MKILALVTARGGSKRVPRKNIKDFLGKPLLAWTIEVALASRVLDRLVLTTEDEDIATVGKKFGAEVPFRRPAHLASDKSSSYDAVLHAMEWLEENQNYSPDWVVLLEPTAPARQPFHIQEAVKIIKERDDLDSLIAISETPSHFSYARDLKRDEKGIISRAYDGEILRRFTMRTQELPKTYFINSGLYAFKVSNLFDGNRSLWGDRVYGYVMDEKYAIDIDTPYDWQMAELKMKLLLDEKGELL